MTTLSTAKTISPVPAVPQRTRTPGSANIPIGNAVLAALMIMCGGSQQIAVLSVGGTYETQVTLLPDGNTCGPEQVQNNQTIVAQSPGSNSLSLTHAGFTYSGTVDRTGHFTIPPTQRSGFVISIAGQFDRTGFTATVTVDPQQPPCEYKVGWNGSKDDSPNTFP